MSQKYQDLEVWKRSVDAAVAVYEIVKKLPKEELYSLSDQIKRSAISVPSNIAEGQSRFHSNDQVHFMSIALGSLSELETQLIIAERTHKLDVAELLTEYEIISRMLRALITSLRKRT